MPAEKKIALYPILGVTGDWLDEPFDLRQLPATILPNVTVEDTEALFTKNPFDLWKEYVSKHQLESLQRVRYALVCRYTEAYGEADFKTTKEAETLVRYLGACLRLIRPMVQDASFIKGRLLEDATLYVEGFENPSEHDVPQVQKLFRLRNADVARLQRLAPMFMAAMNGEFVKFRSAIEFHDWGHFMHLYWKARLSLWCSAIEALYTSNSREHKGSFVATERIKWFLGPTTPIYEAGDIQDGQADVRLTIGDVVNDLYDLRNVVAHGDRTPARFFDEARTDYGESINLATVLTEAASRIIRASLLRILEENLLKEFSDGQASELYFGGQGLTRSALFAKAQAEKNRVQAQFTKNRFNE
jgi:hypothetical protein